MSRTLTFLAFFCLSLSAFAGSNSTRISEVIRQSLDSKSLQEEVSKNNLNDSDLVSVSYKYYTVEAVYKSKTRECVFLVPFHAWEFQNKIYVESFDTHSKCK